MQQHRAETQIVHEEQILEAIDQLRRRKARPDADRICNYLLRKFSVDARDTIADLHRLIEAEKVIQVDYKGNTSYRNASKWSRLQLYKNRPETFVKEKLNSAMVAGAVAELVVEEPDYLDQGVPAYRLVEQLLDGVSNPTSRKMVEDFLGKEVSSGNVARLANGNYSLVASTDMTSVAEAATSVPTTTTTTTGTSSSSMSDSSVSASAHHQQRNNNNNQQQQQRNNNNNQQQQQQQQQKREAADTASRCYATENGNGTAKSLYGLTSLGDRATSASARNRKSPDPPGLYDFDEEDVMVTDSRSSTPRSSRQASPGEERPVVRVDDKNNKEECYEITVVGREPDSPEESITKDDLESREEDSQNSIADSRKGETKIVENNFSNLKRSSKAERKQRLLVRSEDPMDIEIKFENFGREPKDERDKHRHRDLDLAHHSDERDDDDAGRSSTNPSPTPSNTTVGAFRSARRKVNVLF